MFRNILLFFAAGLIFCWQPIRAQAVVLSAQATVSLVTVAPGEELYSVFGHTAVWIQDPQTGINEVYNYGTFDFNESNFYIKYIRGKLLYALAIGKIENMVYGAQYENRTVTAQQLNLSAAQTSKLYAFLQRNYQPDQRYYKYDHFYDNCTTRVRDALQSVCGDSLKFGQNPDSLTFRQWIDRYLQHHHYADFGIDLGISSPADKPASSDESMFLPDNLMNLTATATVMRNGRPEKFELTHQTLFQAVPRPALSDGITPTMLFWLLLAVGVLITIWQFRGTGRQFWLDAVLFSVIGLLGWLLAFLWFGTDHRATVQNWHLWWALPLHFPVALWLLRKHKANWLRIYFILYLALLVLLLVSWKFIPQRIDYELIPIVLLLALRSAFLVFRMRLSVRQTAPQPPKGEF